MRRTRDIPAARFAILAAALLCGLTSGTLAQNQSIGQAKLNTLPEHQKLMERADEFAAQGRYDLAILLWQRVLDESNDSLFTRDAWSYETIDGNRYQKYRSLAQEIARGIAKLPADGLKVYRGTADVQAFQLLADEANREEALAAVIQKYFLSSQGDNAAFELAGRALDRFDFLLAARLLTRLAEEYPDSEIPREEVLLRLAVANAHLGDQEAARNLLDQIAKAGPGVTAVRDYLGQFQDEPARPAQQGGWPLALGNAARSGHMRSLPPEALDPGPLSTSWDDAIFGEGADLALQRRQQQQLALHLGIPPQLLRHDTNASLLAKWKDRGWMPAGEAVLHDGRVFYKTQGQLVCRDLATGKLQWAGHEYVYAPVLYQFISPRRMIIRNRVVIRRQAGQQPQTVNGIEAFGDRIAASLSICGDLLVAIEGYPTELIPEGGNDGRPRAGIPIRRRWPQQLQAPGRQRYNWLSAYEVHSGKLVWAVPGDGKQGDTSAGFLSAPVPFGNLLLASQVQDGTICLAALRRESGEVVWKTRLCSEPEGGVAPWASIQLAASGGDVYAATGAGAVFALDGLTGGILWVTQYPRTADPGNEKFFAGWQADVVMAAGKTLVVIPSDGSHCFGLDRRSGDFVWEAPRAPLSGTPTDYCLGLRDGCFYLAGDKMLRCYKAQGGRLLWEMPLPGATGRGALTSDAIYMPFADSIWKVDPREAFVSPDQRVLAKTQVDLRESDLVGNLFTDGEHLVAVGLSHLVALAGPRQRLKQLAQRIDDGDQGALAERIKIYLDQDKLDEAIADIKTSYGFARERLNESSAASHLFRLVLQARLTVRRPLEALAMLADTGRHAALAESPRQLNRERAVLLADALEEAKQQELRGSAKLWMSLAEVCEEESLLLQLRQRLRLVAGDEDLPTFREALKQEDARTAALAVTGLAAALKNKADEELRPLLKSSIDRVRLEAAWELANRGQRDALPVLGKLMESDDPQVRIRTVITLWQLTGENFGYSIDYRGGKQEQVAHKWQEWISTHEESELKHPIHDRVRIPVPAPKPQNR